MSRISCSICYDFIISDHILLHLQCGHIYHDYCLSEWMVKSPTCPDCRSIVTGMPSRVYPTFDAAEDDLTQKLRKIIEQLQTENKKFAETIQQITPKVKLLDQDRQFLEMVKLKLAEKSNETINLSNRIWKLEQQRTELEQKNREISKINRDVEEHLNLIRGDFVNLNAMIFTKNQESTALNCKINDLEKRIQMMEMDAQLDSHIKTIAFNERDEAIKERNQLVHQLNGTHQNLLEAENTIKTMSNANNNKNEMEITQEQNKKLIDQINADWDARLMEAKIENLKLTMQLKRMQSMKENKGNATTKRKSSKNVEFAEFQPPIKIILRKNKMDHHFSCMTTSS